MSLPTIAIVTSKTTKETRYFEDGEQVFPCRCGKTHRGDYAAYDYGHHNCFHDAPLREMDKGHPELGFLCPECGESFAVERGS